MRSLRSVLAVAVVGAAALSADAAAQPPSPNVPDAARVARHAAAFARLDVHDLGGRRHTANTLRGRVVVLDFWATWCAPCLAEIPVLRQVHERLGDVVTVVGINLDASDQRSVRAWLNRHRIDWPQVWEDGGYESPLARAFDVTALPTSIVLDHDGRIVALDARGDDLVGILEQLVGGRQTQLGHGR